MDDFVINVRQISQYPQQTAAGATDAVLLQSGGLAGPYNWMTPADLVGSALLAGGDLRLAAGSAIRFNGASITWNNGFVFSGGLWAEAVNAQSMAINGEPVATHADLDVIAGEVTNSVRSFNTRTGNVQLESNDILRAGGILQNNPHFTGTVLVPTIWDPRSNDEHAASTAFVQATICHWLTTAPLVQSFNGRSGAVVLTADDVTAAAYLTPGDYIRAPNPALGDVSDRVATCAFVDESLMDLQDALESELHDAISGAYAPINSPNFTGHPTAPTPAPGDNTGNLATTAFVHAAVVASTTGVASFNTRTGAVTLQSADITGAGGALLVSPVFTGNPQAPTAVPGNSSTSIATTAFVQAAIAAIPTAGVSSFNTRTGAVTLNTGDITAAGGAPIASPALSGSPTAPTAAPGTSTTQIATTAFVAAAVAGSTAGVSSFNTRTGAVTLQANDISAAGGALLNSPGLTGIPTAPTATVGTASTQLATTAFVQNQIAAIAAGVSSFNTRTGVVTLLASDITGVGGALLNSPALVGTPTAPTAAQTSNDTTIATTAYVRAALAAAPGGVSSFNTRTGAITLVLADISAAGGAPINSPSFTGTVSAPTPSPGNNSQQVATTAFVMSAISTSGGVNSFNGRAGAVVLNSADIISASGAIYAQNDTAPATGPNNTFWFDSLHGQLYVQYKDPVSNALSWLIANSPPSQPVPALAGQLTGLGLTWNSTANLTIAPGAACSDDNSTTMILSASNFNKNINAMWIAGSNNGCADVMPITASSWYHVFLIMNPTTGVVDLLSSKSLTPAMPSGFTLKRRIGSILTDASINMLAFSQLGDDFIWNTPIANYSAASLGVGDNQILNITAPVGVRTIWAGLFYTAATGTGSYITFGAGDASVVANTPTGNLTLQPQGSSIGAAAEIYYKTNTASQIKCAVGGGVVGSSYVISKGWRDSRGK